MRMRSGLGAKLAHEGNLLNHRPRTNPNSYLLICELFDIEKSEMSDDARMDTSAQTMRDADETMRPMATCSFIIQRIDANCNVSQPKNKPNTKNGSIHRLHCGRRRHRSCRQRPFLCLCSSVDLGPCLCSFDRHLHHREAGHLLNYQDCH